MKYLTIILCLIFLSGCSQDSKNSNGDTVENYEANIFSYFITPTEINEGEQFSLKVMAQMKDGSFKSLEDKNWTFEYDGLKIKNGLTANLVLKVEQNGKQVNITGMTAGQVAVQVSLAASAGNNNKIVNQIIKVNKVNKNPKKYFFARGDKNSLYKKDDLGESLVGQFDPDDISNNPEILFVKTFKDKVLTIAYDSRENNNTGRQLFAIDQNNLSIQQISNSPVEGWECRNVYYYISSQAACELAGGKWKANTTINVLHVDANKIIYLEGFPDSEVKLYDGVNTVSLGLVGYGNLNNNQSQLDSLYFSNFITKSKDNKYLYFSARDPNAGSDYNFKIWKIDLSTNILSKLEYLGQEVVLDYMFAMPAVNTIGDNSYVFFSRSYQPKIYKINSLGQIDEMIIIDISQWSGNSQNTSPLQTKVLEDKDGKITYSVLNQPRFGSPNLKIITQDKIQELSQVIYQNSANFGNPENINGAVYFSENSVLQKINLNSGDLEPIMNMANPWIYRFKENLVIFGAYNGVLAKIMDNDIIYSSMNISLQMIETGSYDIESDKIIVSPDTFFDLNLNLFNW